MHQYCFNGQKWFELFMVYKLKIIPITNKKQNKTSISTLSIEC